MWGRMAVTRAGGSPPFSLEISSATACSHASFSYESLPERAAGTDRAVGPGVAESARASGGMFTKPKRKVTTRWIRLFATRPAP